MLDPYSPIADFYPSDFVTDTKGKKFAWMGEVLLPFIEEDRLLEAISEKDEGLTPFEKERNEILTPVLYMRENVDTISHVENNISGKIYKDKRFKDIGS